MNSIKSIFLLIMLESMVFYLVKLLNQTKLNKLYF